MTEKVRIKSLIEETRVAIVNVASSSGALTGVQDLSDIDTEDEDESDTPIEGDDDTVSDHPRALSIPLSLSRVYKRTLEILGDSLVESSLPLNESSSHPPT